MAIELTLSAQTMFAQVVDASRAVNLSRSVADLSGHFAKRTIKGKDYWYFRFRDLDGVERMAYVGPDSEALRVLIDKSKRPSARTGLRQLAQAAIDLGAAPIPRRQYRVIARLSEFGFFRAGGVLIGTHAFLIFGNMFGVRWGMADRTQDVDFAHAGRYLALALPANIRIDKHSAIQSLEQGFTPLVSFDGKAGASYRHPTDAAFQLDFLTTMHRGGDRPYAHPDLGVVLQPLKFMEFLLEDLTESAVLSEEGAVIVNLPAPARYAVHKLIVYGERFGSASSPKQEKDLAQANELIGHLRHVRPERVEEAWRDLIDRGAGWAKRARAGLAALDAYAPDSKVRAWLDREARPIRRKPSANKPTRAPRSARPTRRASKVPPAKAR